MIESNNLKRLDEGDDGGEGEGEGVAKQPLNGWLLGRNSKQVLPLSTYLKSQLRNNFMPSNYIICSLLLFVLFISNCTANSFQTILYNVDYIATNESTALSVDTNFGVIPLDSSGRPNTSFHMDYYEYPNHPRDKTTGDLGSLPTINVNWYEARDICRSYGKRLCSIYEWRETCYSDGQGKRKTDKDSSYEYPYQGAYQNDICVTNTSSAATVGARPGCVTSEIPGGQKIGDLSGNVWEWVNHDFYGQADQFQGQQAIVGGYYFSTDKAKCGLTLIQSTNIRSDKVGFRCCRDKDLP